MIRHYILLIFFTLSSLLFAQRGGESMYGVLRMTQSARIATLGGNQVGLPGNEVSMLNHNPAIIDSTWAQNMSFSYIPYVAGIHYGFAGVAWEFENLGTFAFSVYHLNYGSLVGADESGNETGKFGAGETVLQINYGKKITENWRAGLSIKPLMSKIESYSSWAIASDIGVFYENADMNFAFGAVLKNYGTQITSYSDAKTEFLKPDLQIGVSQKLHHAPFRVSLTAKDLLTSSLSYEVKDADNNPIIREADSIEKKIFRRLVLGVEFVPTDNFYVGIGVDPRRRQELKVDSRTSTVGYSWGFGIKVYKFNISYGSTRYHLAGTSNYFSITTSLSSFM